MTEKPLLRMCLLCLTEFAGSWKDDCPKCGGTDTMGISSTARDANEERAARWRRENI